MNIFKRIGLSKKTKKKSPLQKKNSFKNNKKGKKDRLQKQLSFESSSDDLSILNVCYEEESTIDERSEFFSIAPYKDDDESTCCFVAIRNSHWHNNDNKENAKKSNDKEIPTSSVNDFDESTAESSLIYDINSSLKSEQHSDDNFAMLNITNSMDYSQSALEESVLDTPVRCGSSRKCIQVDEIKKITELFPSCNGGDLTSLESEKVKSSGDATTQVRESDAKSSLRDVDQSQPVDVDEFISEFLEDKASISESVIEPKEDKRNKVGQHMKLGKKSDNHRTLPQTPFTVSNILPTLSVDDDDHNEYQEFTSEVLYPKPSNIICDQRPFPYNSIDRHNKYPKRQNRKSNFKVFDKNRDVKVVTPENSPGSFTKRQKNVFNNIDDKSTDIVKSNDGVKIIAKRGRSRTPRKNREVDRVKHQYEKKKTERSRHQQEEESFAQVGVTDNERSNQFNDGSSPVKTGRSFSNCSKKDLLNKRKCVICVKRNRTHLAVPCMHFSFCEACALDLSQNLKNVACPICNEQGVTFAKLQY